jgi:hypothetical protein
MPCRRRRRREEDKRKVMMQREGTGERVKQKRKRENVRMWRKMEKGNKTGRNMRKRRSIRRR